jgi:hypothetical protein
MAAAGPIDRGQRVRIERRPKRSLAALARPRTVHQPAPWPEVWEGMVLQVTYEGGDLIGIEVYGRRESTGETKRVTFSLARNRFFRTTVTLVESP